MKPIIADTDDRRWQAVCDRDVRADGQFVFAVLTTGICCRPSCRSRRARENVRFTPVLRRLSPMAFVPVSAASRIEAIRSNRRWTKLPGPVACWNRKRR